MAEILVFSNNKVMLENTWVLVEGDLSERLNAHSQSVTASVMTPSKHRKPNAGSMMGHRHMASAKSRFDIGVSSCSRHRSRILPPLWYSLVFRHVLGLGIWLMSPLSGKIQYSEHPGVACLASEYS